MNFDHLVRSCAGLVTVDTGSQIVRLIHQTAQDFFGTRASEYFPDAHTRLTRTCLTYLFFDEFSQGPCDTPFALEEPIEPTRNIFTRLKRNPFMYYAAYYWGHHAHGEATERALEREILDFLSTPRALASTVQVQYAITWPDTKRSLDSSKHTPIHVVLSFKLEHTLEALLKTVTAENLNVEDETKKTAFHWAVELGLADCARSLLVAGADIRTRDCNGFTALYKASSFRHEYIVKMILEHDKTAEASAEEVSCAILYSQKLFLERYIQSAPKPTDRANSVLMQSLAEPGLIEFAISHGADVNFEDERGRTALLEAVDTGSSTAAQALVAAGASISVLEEGTGKTFLQVAASSQIPFKERPVFMRKTWHRMAEIAYRSHRPRSHKFSVRIPNDLPHQFSSRCIEDIIAFAASFKDSELLAALDEDYDYPDIIRLLLNNGADLGVKTSGGETVLHLAVGSTTRVEVLLNMRAHELGVDVQDKQGRSALHHAAAVGNYAAMEVLLANGASLELRDFGGASTLHYAVGHSACVELAIQKGCNTKAVDSQKRTALHYFTMIERPPQKQGYPDQPDILHQLLKAGVDPDAIDSQGKKASDYHCSSSVGPHGFEETALWIGIQLSRRQYLLQQAKFAFLLRRQCEEEDSWDDSSLLEAYSYLVSYTHRHM